MANINWNRHSYVTKMDRDYFTNPKLGFDSAWHKQNKKLKAQRAEAKLAEQRKLIKALRNTAHKVGGPV